MEWDNLDFEEIRHVCIYIYRREIGREEHLLIYNKIRAYENCEVTYINNDSNIYSLILGFYHKPTMAVTYINLYMTY